MAVGKVHDNDPNWGKRTKGNYAKQLAVNSSGKPGEAAEEKTKNQNILFLIFFYLPAAFNSWSLYASWNTFSISITQDY